MKPLVLPRLADPEGKGIHRVLISTPLAESGVAAFLTELAAKVEPKGVKVGSYPRWEKNRNTVTLVGRSVVQSAQSHVHCQVINVIHRDRDYLESLVAEVEQGVQGLRVNKEDEADELTN